MKRLLTLSLLIGPAFFSYGQKAITFAEAKEQHLQVAQLDSLYKSGIYTDTALAVFKTNPDAYVAAYQQLLQDLGKFLKANGFLWERPVRGFNRIYFNKDGKIDYFLYSFRPGQLTAAQEEKFGKLVNKFIRHYRFPLTAPVKFAQCSPVTYMPALQEMQQN